MIQAPLLTGFRKNGLSANQDKFQAMFFGDTISEITKIDLQGTDIPFVNSIKTLGVHIDKNLNFKVHVSQICAKAGRQLNVLRRISKYSNVSCRMTI